MNYFAVDNFLSSAFQLTVQFTQSIPTTWRLSCIALHIVYLLCLLWFCVVIVRFFLCYVLTAFNKYAGRHLSIVVIVWFLC